MTYSFVLCFAVAIPLIVGGAAMSLSATRALKRIVNDPNADTVALVKTIRTRYAADVAQLLGIVAMLLGFAVVVVALVFEAIGRFVP